MHPPKIDAIFVRGPLDLMRRKVTPQAHVYEYYDEGGFHNYRLSYQTWKGDPPIGLYIYEGIKK